MDIIDILKSFEFYDKIYKRDAVEAAINNRLEITPHLISILNNVIKTPEKYTNQDDPYFEHIYAFMLLGYFKEVKSHDILIDIFSLPGDLPDQLYGDFIAGNLPIILLRTCGGNTDRIKELILNKGAYEYCRGAALQALSYAVIDDYESREDVLLFYNGLFTGKEASSSSCFHDVLATCVYDLYPDTLKNTIDDAYENGLIFPGYISPEDFENILQIGKDECLAKLKQKVQDRQIDNLHDSMSWWACFKQPQTRKASSIDLLKVKNKPKISNRKKAKNRHAKKSRKKNRRK